MAYTKASYDLSNPKNPSGLAENLGLKNLGISFYVFERGEGFDFFHNHREQEEIYMCLEGSADLKIGGDSPATVTLKKGDVVRVDPQTLRAIGNESSERALVLIAGACAHTYPAGIGHHDVIADVLSLVGTGTTGFTIPKGVETKALEDIEEDC